MDLSHYHYAISSNNVNSSSAPASPRNYSLRSSDSPLSTMIHASHHAPYPLPSLVPHSTHPSRHNHYGHGHSVSASGPQPGPPRRSAAAALESVALSSMNNPGPSNSHRVSSNQPLYNGHVTPSYANANGSPAVHTHPDAFLAPNAAFLYNHANAIAAAQAVAASNGSSAADLLGGYGPPGSTPPRLPPILQVEKQQVTTSATQAASASRRRNEAHFICPVPGCGSTFTRRFNLRGHLRSHTEERPYVCEWPGCNKGFARQHDCKRHQALHSTKTTSNVCSGCQKTFSRLDALNRHLRSEGGAECRKAQQQQLSQPGTPIQNGRQNVNGQAKSQNMDVKPAIMNGNAIHMNGSAPRLLHRADALSMSGSGSSTYDSDASGSGMQSAQATPGPIPAPNLHAP